MRGAAPHILHKTWRHDHKLTDDLLEARMISPACDRVSLQEGQGRLIIRGSGLAKNRALIRSRIENVAVHAMATQPERRIVSIDTIDSKDEDALEVLTTSQKLTHRIAHELKKLFGGQTLTTGATMGRSSPPGNSRGPGRKQRRPGKPTRAADRAAKNGTSALSE